MSEFVDLAERAFRRAVGRRVLLAIDGKCIVGKVLPGLSPPGPLARRFRLRARHTHYVLLDMAPRLRLLPPAPIRPIRRRQAL